MPITTIEPIITTEPTTTPTSEYSSERQAKEHIAPPDADVETHQTITTTTTSATPGTKEDVILPHVLAEHAQHIIEVDKAEHNHNPPHMHLTPYDADHIQHIHGHHGHEHEHDHDHTHEHADDVAHLDHMHEHNAHEEHSTEHVISSTANDIFAESKEPSKPLDTPFLESNAHAEGVNDTHGGEKIVHTPAEVLINQISHEFEEDDKDLNNFRHPATLITASNSDESMMAAMMAAAMKENERDTTAAMGEPAARHEEDPYHAHILSEQHDRLAEQEDFKLIAEDLNSSTESHLETTTQKGGEVAKKVEANAEDNLAVVVPAIAMITTTNTTNEERGRAMNIVEVEQHRAEEAPVVTTTPPSSAIKEPVVVPIVEGQLQHQHTDNHMHVDDHTTTEITTTTKSEVNNNNSEATLKSDEDSSSTPYPQHFYYHGEGRSVGDSISAENDDVPLNYQYHNFVTTERDGNNNNKSVVHKSGALLDLSDINMDEDDKMDVTHNTHEQKQQQEQQQQEKQLVEHNHNNHSANEGEEQQLKITEVTKAAVGAAAAAMLQDCTGSDEKMYK
ncbi:PREDICTED: putative epidermal cell surface receptor, partial [Rhagoletis zephyria]|uniref:putative epidermal cell surface receptor n=1 Tax=Rhagoletis zephyria TaxID=28612 RepID=UPI0008118D26